MSIRIWNTKQMCIESNGNFTGELEEGDEITIK